MCCVQEKSDRIGIIGQVTECLESECLVVSLGIQESSELLTDIGTPLQILTHLLSYFL